MLPLYVSLKLSLVTTVVLTVLAAPLAYGLALWKFRGKSIIEALINLTMVLPPTVMGFYLVMLMGPKGAVGHIWEKITGGSLLFTFRGIAAALIVCSFPFALQPLKAAFQKIDQRIMENAYVLGLSRPQAFFRVIIPDSLSGIAAAAILVFLHSMGAFGVLLMVGGSVPGETKVAAIAVYEAVESINYREAGLMSLCLVGISHLRDRKPGRVSCGERQRCAICQVLARNPQVLLPDEPFSALDFLTCRKLKQEIKLLKKEITTPIVYVTHDIQEAFALADGIFPVVDGRIDKGWLQQTITGHAVCRGEPGCP